jgi:hypothetical protein
MVIGELLAHGRLSTLILMKQLLCVHQATCNYFTLSPGSVSTLRMSGKIREHINMLSMGVACDKHLLIGLPGVSLKAFALFTPLHGS